MRIIEAAKEAGADAVKLQTYTADTITHRKAIRKYFRDCGGGTLWDGRNLHDLYGEAYTPVGMAAEAERESRTNSAWICFRAPSTTTAVDFLEQMDVPAHKVASFELVDIPSDSARWRAPASR